jgi:hypothetical protein
MTAALILYVLFGLLLYMGIGGCKKEFPFWVCLLRLMVSVVLGPFVFAVGLCIAWRRMRRPPQ